MKRTKNRLKNKILKRVVLGQKLGIMQKFYAMRAARIIGDMFDHQYLTVFRPSWYDSIEKWSEMSLSTAVRQFADNFHQGILKDIGIDMKELNIYLMQFPKRPYREREPKEPKPQPIRKLKRPEEFFISFRNTGGLIENKSVTGEKVFSIQGYDFFIRHDEMYGWVVSDVAEGKRISSSSRYTEAVKNSKEIIEKHIDEYIKRISATQELGNKL